MNMQNCELTERIRGGQDSHAVCLIVQPAGNVMYNLANDCFFTAESKIKLREHQFTTI